MKLSKNVEEFQKFIKENWSTKTLKEIGEQFGVCHATVTKYARQMGMSKNLQLDQE